MKHSASHKTEVNTQKAQKTAADEKENRIESPVLFLARFALFCLFCAFCSVR
jgi:hypothetical protein